MADAAHTFGNPNVWHWAPSRAYHVENYKLALHFDETTGEVFGDEVVALRPFEPHFRIFYLDSAGLKIDAVSLEEAVGAAAKLTYAAKRSRLWITLDHEYDPTNTLKVRITYHGFPRTGLFFVNPTRYYPQWPREVYSQGEPEFNHYWFPCWDYPNDMSTSETITTVPEGQSVVSNGKLVRVTQKDDKATYDWVESVPHSSYLISIAVGPWRKFSDQYENKPVDYYVPNYVSESTARRSFHLTPDMIGFFSRATGVDYPYEKYAQTTVHNFIFGGQENVSATTLTEYTLHDSRADQDYPSTELVSHELGQHWFGDYVQAHDWADIWLNEGFATYLSALYTQYHEGDDAYRFEIYQDQLAAQQQDRNDYLRSIVDRHYIDPLQMFDAITHEKGAAVLNMLRYLIDGEEAASHPASQGEPFFRALHNYLLVHHEHTANTADLLDAIRVTTGQEFGWFFHQWVFMAGYPEYHVKASYDQSTKFEKVTVTQNQQGKDVPAVFDMPIELVFFGKNGEQKEVQIRDNLRQQVFDIPVAFGPQWIDFDPEDFIDKTVQFDQPLGAVIAEAEQDPFTMSRLSAVQQLGAMAHEDPDTRSTVLARILAGDEFYAVRAAAATSLGNIRSAHAKSALLTALRQPDSRVRTAVVQALGNFSRDSMVYMALIHTMHEDPSYATEAAAATDLGKSGLPRAFDALRAEVATKPEVHVMQAVLNGLAATKDPRAVAILLSQSQPGVPERIRLNALATLASFKEILEREHKQALIKTVRGALDDPFLPVRQNGEKLVGIFDLSQFRSDVQKDASAPLAMQRDLARQVLDQLDHQR